MTLNKKMLSDFFFCCAAWAWPLVYKENAAHGNPWGLYEGGCRATALSTARRRTPEIKSLGYILGS